MKIAVTGANGHVGVNLCKRLLESGHEVHALIHKNAKNLEHLPIRLFHGDLLDKSSLSSFADGCEILFHLAARISITGGQNNLVTETNATGTRNVIETVKSCKVRRMVHFSSIHAFSQHPSDEVLDETRPLVSNGGFSYDCSKATGERSVLEAVKQGMDAVIISPTAIIGPDDPEPSLVGKAVIDIYNHNIPSLIPGGYDWVDVRDVVSGAISAMEHGRSGEKYLLSGHYHSLKEFSSTIANVTGRKTVQTLIPLWLARFGLPFTTLYSRILGTEPLYTRESLTIITEGSRLISHKKAEKELNYNPRPLLETIEDLVLWFKEQKRIN